MMVASKQALYISSTTHGPQSNPEKRALAGNMGIKGEVES
jgi:hypothetical protein